MTESKEKIEFKSFLEHLKESDDSKLLEETLSLHNVLSFAECFRDIDLENINNKKKNLDDMKNEILKRMTSGQCHHAKYE